MQIRVVWFSGVNLSNTTPNKSGTWIYSMYKELQKTNEINIVANFIFSNVKKITEIKNGNLKQFLIPYSSIRKDKIGGDTLDYICRIIQELNPSILHIWGTESYWCTLYKEPLFIKYKKLLEIQGLKFFWGKKDVFFAGLTESRIKKMNGILELLNPKLKISEVRLAFEKWGNIEKEVLASAEHINTQSEWVRDVMTIVAPKAQLHKTEIILRDSFLNTEPWTKTHKVSSHPVIFTTTSIQPYKGMHVTLKAFSHILKKYPKAELRVAGISIKRPKYRNVGYVNFLLGLLEKYRIKENVTFLGNLDEFELISEMENSDVFVNSSYVESYCLALAEALSFGMPCVATYTSALTELIQDNKTGLFYPIGDDMICASRIIKLLEDKDLSTTLSNNASTLFRKTINPQRIANQQVAIYKSMI